MDQTIKHQDNNKETCKSFSDSVAKVPSGKVVHYLCVIKPTNAHFLDSSTEIYRMWDGHRFDVSTIMG